VDNLTYTTNSLLQLLIESGREVVDFVGVMELWLRTLFTTYGVTPMVQTLLLVGITAALMLLSARVLNGLARATVILPLVLIACHLVLPAFQH
jgi:hypothetical protein